MFYENSYLIRQWHLSNTFSTKTSEVKKTEKVCLFCVKKTITNKLKRLLQSGQFCNLQRIVIVSLLVCMQSQLRFLFCFASFSKTKKVFLLYLFFQIIVLMLIRYSLKTMNALLIKYAKIMLSCIFIG